MTVVCWLTLAGAVLVGLGIDHLLERRRDDSAYEPPPHYDVVKAKVEAQVADLRVDCEDWYYRFPPSWERPSLDRED